MKREQLDQHAVQTAYRFSMFYTIPLAVIGLLISVVVLFVGKQPPGAYAAVTMVYVCLAFVGPITGIWRYYRDPAALEWIGKDIEKDEREEDRNRSE